MKICVAVATTGRPALARQTLGLLADQTRAPDAIFAVGAQPEDIKGLDEIPGMVTAIAPRGSCSQRNYFLEHLCGGYDVVVILDDDFVPAANFLEQAERILIEGPDIVGLNGHVLADGITGPGIAFEEALEIIDRYSRRERTETPAPRPIGALYGCNMVLRLSAIGDLRFDESLPLYGWQEDIDFTFQLGRRGRLLVHHGLAGVHMGVKHGRTPGKKFGYSQIANPIYLLRKGTLPKTLAASLIFRNLVSNVLKSAVPEPYVDRRGRLTGNLIAVWDLFAGKLHPRRILDLG